MWKYLLMPDSNKFPFNMKMLERVIMVQVASKKLDSYTT